MSTSTANADRFGADNSFVIDNYNEQAPFASFLPGIAGPTGRPAWAFYVNRGQAISSFGVRNKDGAILEFYPADKAYQLTASRGFRTFLKVSDGSSIRAHEPFQRGAAADVLQRLHVSAHEVGVEDINPTLGLAIRADSFTLPHAPLAALVRRVSLTNTSATRLQVDIADGLPQILPFGMNLWCAKYMSRTIEALMVVDGLAHNCPFYRLKVYPGDTPQVVPVVGGTFMAGFVGQKRTSSVVDSEKIFGAALDFSSAEGFFANASLDLSHQVAGNRTPSAFQVLTLTLAPGETRCFYGLYGQAPSWEALQTFLASVNGADYFEAKRTENRELVHGLMQRAFTATALPEFDAYAQQCYLDNGLRGGFSMPVPGGARLHLYGRKHGDVERDYNDFLVQDTPYSEGNGDFRDMLQNRRTDLFFDPQVGARNVRYFFNLIQADGYNPLVLRNSNYVVADPQTLAAECAQVPGLAQLIEKPFKYGALWQVVSAACAAPDAVLAQVLQAATEVEDAEFEKGYWSDHWTYLVDLLQAYGAIFPERLGALLTEGGYTFYDSTHRVLPRRHKLMRTFKGLRQYGAVQPSKEKSALIAQRTQQAHRARSMHGHGEVVSTTLLGKVLTLLGNKLASLDPLGIGIEMEADRPGWCDALNGLPGLLGSSVNETIELQRLVDFTLETLLSTPEAPTCALPSELAQLLTDLLELLRAQVAAPDALGFWHASHDMKETYREAVFMGFSGDVQTLAQGDVQELLRLSSSFLARAAAKARTPDGMHTYYAFTAEAFTESPDGGIVITRFSAQPLPLFLEGFVHAMRVSDPAAARQLYLDARASDLYDRALGMYRLNVPLGENALELGRVGTFHYGWLENGSVFLHMHYKFVLEMLRAGLVDEFYADMHQLLVPFRDPAQYKRSPLENSSFIVSSGFAIDAREHGRGCVARLSGSTVEFLHLWTHLFLGAQPFQWHDGQLVFAPQPSLHARLFTAEARRLSVLGQDEDLPAHSAACALLGHTLLVYVNAKQRHTYGAMNYVAPAGFRLVAPDGTVTEVVGPLLRGHLAERVRAGEFGRVEVRLDQPGNEVHLVEIH